MKTKEKEQKEQKIKEFDEKNSPKLTCLRCGHQWISQNVLRSQGRLPVVCPRCKSYKWNEPRKTGGKKQ